MAKLSLMARDDMSVYRTDLFAFGFGKCIDQIALWTKKKAPSCSLGLPCEGNVGSQGSLKNWRSHIDASHSRQPLVKGERLVRYEVNAVMHCCGAQYATNDIMEAMVMKTRCLLFAANCRDTMTDNHVSAPGRHKNITTPSARIWRLVGVLLARQEHTGTYQNIPRNISGTYSGTCTGTL